MATNPPTEPQPDTGPVESPEPIDVPTELPPMPGDVDPPVPMQA
jgi:hypothetical protein